MQGVAHGEVFARGVGRGAMKLKNPSSKLKGMSKNQLVRCPENRGGERSKRGADCRGEGSSQIGGHCMAFADGSAFDLIAARQPVEEPVDPASVGEARTSDGTDETQH